MRENICLHVGEAGVKIGNALWELFCIEHGIAPDGKKNDTTYNDQYKLNCADESFFQVFDGVMFPRSTMVDLEPTLIEKIKKGPHKNRFNFNNFIYGKEDASSNFARGKYTIGKNFVQPTVESLRRLSEECNSLQGFFGFESWGGGTGSGLGSLIHEEICTYFPKKSKMQYVVYPGPKISDCIVEPYNTILAFHDNLEMSDSACTFMMDNEALYDICDKKLGVSRPNYLELNRIISQAVSSVTASLRFYGTINTDLADFQVNLVPFPRLKYPVTSFAPMTRKNLASMDLSTVQSITMDNLDPSNHLVKCDMSSSTFLACCLCYRGDILPRDVSEAVNSIKQNKVIRFVDWCPTGFKVGMNNQPPSNFPNDHMANLPKACCMVANTTAVVAPWRRVCDKFDLMFHKRAFFHWYQVEGMELDEFTEARASVETIQAEYKEVEKNELE